MKYIVFIIAFSAWGCNNDTKPLETQNFTKTQIGLQKIIDSFKVEYTDIGSKLSKDSVADKYNNKIFQYLSSNALDSIKIHVDAIVKKDSTITTKFHYSKDVAFQYGLTFTKPTNSFFDSLYHFMNGLKAGADTIVDFSYMGSHLLGDPRDTLMPTLTIYAVPTFLRKNK